MDSRIKLFLLSMILMISGCSNILPGMQNLDISRMPIQQIPQTVVQRPVVIPITPSLLASQSLATYIYHVEPQDILSIMVWQYPEFNPPPQQTATAGTQSSQAAGQSGYLVNPEGRIKFPLVGYVDVAGKTVDTISDELSYSLKEYLKKPQVVVRVADYRSKKVYVFGEVNRPGLFPLNDQPMTITDALALTGSFDPNAADTRHVYIIRGSLLTPKIYWLNARTPDALFLAEHFYLQPKDVMYVSAAPVTRWNRFLNQLLPSLQTIWYTKAIT